MDLGAVSGGASTCSFYYDLFNYFFWRGMTTEKPHPASRPGLAAPSFRGLSHHRTHPATEKPHPASRPGLVVSVTNALTLQRKNQCPCAPGLAARPGGPGLSHHRTHPATEKSVPMCTRPRGPASRPPQYSAVNTTKSGPDERPRERACRARRATGRDRGHRIQPAGHTLRPAPR